MKLQSTGNQVERSNVGQERGFTIKATSKSFAILSEGIYTDPELAIVRELSCNAFDAHVAAGKADVPFEIHLPNKLEPWFHVRDFGTGMSDEDVMVLYTTYFESTKSDSNAFIGALGIGSKSPFSYTKAFEVISRFNGKRRMYTSFINEEGFPSIAKLGEVDTDEVNGLEIRITIAEADWKKFADKTAKCLRWFPVKPNVIGWPNFKFLEVPKERIEGEGWKMFEANFAGDYSKMTAVQGNVAYKVDISKLGLSPTEERILEQSHLVGFFEIGELEVAASREEIRYDAISKAALKKKIEDCRAGVLKSIEQQVDALRDKSWWDIIIELNNIAQTVFNDRNLFKYFVKDTTNDLIKKYLDIGGTLQVRKLHGHEISIFEQTRGKNGYMTLKRKDVGYGISPEPHISVFYNDLPSGGVARVMEWTRKAPYNGKHRAVAVVIRPQKEVEEITLGTEHEGLTKKRTWVEEDFVKELMQLREDLGGVNFLLASKDAPIPERGKTNYKQELPIFQYGRLTGKYKQSIIWTRTPQIDLAAGGLYFHLLNGAHVAYPDKDGELQNINWGVNFVHPNLTSSIELINKHLGTKYTEKNLYGIGSLAINKIKKNEKWLNIFDILREVVKKYDEAATFFSALDLTPDMHGIKSYCIKPNNKEFVNRVNELDPNSSFKKLTLPLIQDYQKYAKFTLDVRFARQLNIDLRLGLFDNKGSPYFTISDFECYPMFQFIHSIAHESGKTLKALFEYIKLIDRS